MNPPIQPCALSVLPWTVVDATGCRTRRAAWLAACGRLRKHHTNDTAWRRLEFQRVTWDEIATSPAPSSVFATAGIVMCLFPPICDEARETLDSLCRQLVDSNHASATPPFTEGSDSPKLASVRHPPLILLAGAPQLFAVLTLAGVHACVAEPERLESLDRLVDRYLHTMDAGHPSAASS